jgi:hypothetical protein
MDRADGASSSSVAKDVGEEKVGARTSGKLKVVRVKRKREQAPIENLCKLKSDRFLLFFCKFLFSELSLRSRIVDKDRSYCGAEIVSQGFLCTIAFFTVNPELLTLIDK